MNTQVHLCRAFYFVQSVYTCTLSIQDTVCSVDACFPHEDTDWHALSMAIEGLIQRWELPKKDVAPLS